jgi:broad specificity phosphatase PhoE
METLVGLLRHGQTDWNVDMRLQGISDIPLNDFGRNQALVAGQALKSVDWSRIVSSPLSRALETARIVAAVIGHEEVEHYQKLIERSFGVAEGLSYDEWREQYQNGETAPEAESLEDLTRRANDLLESLALDFRGETFLAVSHGALIRRLIHIVSNGELPRDGERFGNASLTTIRHDGNSWSIVKYDPNPLV